MPYVSVNYIYNKLYVTLSCVYNGPNVSSVEVTGVVGVRGGSRICG
jgi:hypothetical protein